VNVAAFSTPTQPDWRWRIVTFAGEVIEESRERFPTIAAAVAMGRRRLVQINVVDRSEPPRMWRRTSRLRKISDSGATPVLETKRDANGESVCPKCEKPIRPNQHVAVSKANQTGSAPRGRRPQGGNI
jgi:hypothetical protein